MNLAQLWSDYHRPIAPLLNLDYSTLTVVISIVKVGLTHVWPAQIRYELIPMCNLWVPVAFWVDRNPQCSGPATSGEQPWCCSSKSGLDRIKIHFFFRQLQLTSPMVWEAKLSASISDVNNSDSEISPNTWTFLLFWIINKKNRLLQPLKWS